MHRFYFASLNISGGQVVVTDKEQLHHIRDVLRLKPKERIMLFDKSGNEYSASIEELNPSGIVLKVKHARAAVSGKFKVTLACAIPKKSKMDEIVDKLTQLGVDRIIPLNTKHVIVKFDEHKKFIQLQRWRRIARGASEQSQRNKLPDIDEVRGIKEVILNSGGFDLKLIPTLTGRRRPLKEILFNSGYKNILVLIGPEGDFSKEEITLAKNNGFIPITLGGHVLRVETAAVAVASFIRLGF